MGLRRPVHPRPISNGMDEDAVSASADGAEGDGEEEKTDSDMIEDSFDDVDNL